MKIIASFVLFNGLFAVSVIAASSLASIAKTVGGGFNMTAALEAAASSGINLAALNITIPALTYMSNLTTVANSSAMKKRVLSLNPNVNTGNAIDVHAHLVFPWFRQMVPTTGGEPTPNWSTEDTLNYMTTYKVGKTILANSAPMANVYMGDQTWTVALARLINLSTAVLKQLYPKQFDFFAVVPLPYVDDAIEEAKYALDTLGAVGIALLTNHEGNYLGNPKFKKFFQYVNSRPGKTIVFIHPTAPVMKVGNKFMEANPTQYSTGIVEFYFETARCMMDLTYTQTLQNNTNIQWITAHVGGAFPSILDRMIKSLGPVLEASSKAIYNTRVWYDSAGPTYPNQVQGLLGYGIPKTQLLFGSDFPYAPSFTYAAAVAGLISAPGFTQANITAILNTNAKNLFGGKLKF